MESPQTIYFDCTTTYFLGLNTGIQRVVRNLGNRSRLIAQHQNIEFIPVVAAFGHFWSLRHEGPLTSVSPTYTRLLEFANRILSPLLQQRKAKPSMGKERGENEQPLELANVARIAVYFVGSSFLYIPFFLAFLKGELRRAKIDSDDVLLMVDAFWFYNELDAAERHAAKGIRIISIIYDLIPITHPEFCSATMKKKFKRMIPRVLKYSSGIIVTAKTIESDLRNYIKNHGRHIGKEVPIEHFFLGSDFYQKTQSPTGSFGRRDELDQILSKAPCFLMVGTIEPRKGHEYVLEAFSAIWEKGSEYQLIIVGRKGWQSDEVLEKIRYHEKRYGKVLAFHDLNDQGLKYLYEKCSALIFASHVEGFGLPLVEAIQSKLPVLASDIDIFHEIGGTYPEYFSLKDPASLVMVLENHDNGAEQKASEFYWPTWDDSISMLIDKTLALASRSTGSELAFGSHR